MDNQCLVLAVAIRTLKPRKSLLESHCVTPARFSHLLNILKNPNLIVGPQRSIECTLYYLFGRTKTEPLLLLQAFRNVNPWNFLQAVLRYGGSLAADHMYGSPS